MILNGCAASIWHSRWMSKDINHILFRNLVRNGRAKLCWSRWCWMLYWHIVVFMSKIAKWGLNLSISKRYTKKTSNWKYLNYVTIGPFFICHALLTWLDKKVVLTCVPSYSTIVCWKVDIIDLPARKLYQLRKPNTNAALQAPQASLTRLLLSPHFVMQWSHVFLNIILWWFWWLHTGR